MVKLMFALLLVFLYVIPVRSSNEANTVSSSNEANTVSSSNEEEIPSAPHVNEYIFYPLSNTIFQKQLDR